MKYPIDFKTVESYFGHLIAHERTQKTMIQALTLALKEAMYETEPSQDINHWSMQAAVLLKFQQNLDLSHENRRFDESNGHFEAPVSLGNIAPIAALTPTGYVPGAIMTPEQNARLNSEEAAFGEELSEEDLAAMFGEKVKKKKEVELSKMSLEEIEEWEAKQNNSNDIYKIKARVANLARGSGASLTAQGEMLCNTFVHVLKSLYEFAEKIEDKELKIKLIEKIRSHENAPATLISAAGAGVK